MSWVLQSNKSRNFDFSLLLSLTIDRSACIGKLWIAEAVFANITCKNRGFEGSLHIERNNVFLAYNISFYMCRSLRCITSLTRKSFASKGLPKIFLYSHTKMADPTLISFRTLFFICQEFTWLIFSEI